MNGSRSPSEVRLILVYQHNRCRLPKTCNSCPIFQQIGKYARMEKWCLPSFTATHIITPMGQAPVKTAPAPVSATGATLNASAICGGLIKRKSLGHHLLMIPPNQIQVVIRNEEQRNEKARKQFCFQRSNIH